MSLDDLDAAGAEVALWRAVLAQALADACITSSDSRALRERDKARKWLLRIAAISAMCARWRC